MSNIPVSISTPPIIKPTVQPTIPTGNATVQILFVQPTATINGTLTLTVTSVTKTVSSNFSVPYSTNTGVIGSNPASTLTTITSINFDQSGAIPYLNFWVGTMVGGNNQHIYISNPSNCPNFSVSDTQSALITYDTSAVTVIGKTITFGGTNSNVLTLTFPTVFV